MQPVLFSVSYAGLWGQAKLSLEEFIPHAKALGYSAVELMGKRPHLSPLDYRGKKVEALGRLCRKHKVRVACVAGYTNFTGGAEAGEVPFADMQVQYVESLAALARELDCDLVRVFTSYERSDLPMAEQWNRTVRALQDCCDRAAPYGVTIGIQNHHDIAVHSRALAEMRRDVGRANCALMLDPWSPCLRNEELFETAKGLAPQVVYTTLADYVRLPRYQYQPTLINYRTIDLDLVRAVPMGEGDLDSATFIKGLKAGGFDGPIAYEMCSPLRGGGSAENLDRCACRFLEWLEANGLE
ncbi:MAG: isomerase [Lentisphaerae bacterium RIFOXYB12_FULL_65_16]|nr:MAG: isomerase [Lentisphaerae bacterium RIFOXYA12_64_32]OGV88937.1 MAG: isomerase [Lentisphaerae bacterium RIFOXYB12_FULL_65_16]